MKVNDVKNSQTQLVIPPSIKSEMDMLGETDPAEMNIPLIQHSAETIHNPGEGMASGLDADEIAILSKLSPDLKEQYETMANSNINKENLRNDISKVREQLEDAQKKYDKINKKANNWFLNIFRSADAKEKLQTELSEAQKQLEYSQLKYDVYSKNVISYSTIKQRKFSDWYGKTQQDISSSAESESVNQNSDTTPAPQPSVTNNPKPTKTPSNNF